MSQKLIDRELLEKLQTQFSGANDMYLACLDANHKVLSACYQTGAEKRFFEERMPEQVVKHLLAAVDKSQVESIIEEKLEIPYMKLCAVVSRIEEEIVLIWVAAAVIEDYLTEEDTIPEYVLRMSEDQFYRSIGFLESMTKQLFAAKEQELHAVELMERTTDTEQTLKEQLRRNEASAEIVHMLESEEPFEVIANKIIRIVCETLDIQGASILNTWGDGNTICLTAEYSTEEKWDFGRRLNGKTKVKLPFYSGKTYVLSSNSMMSAELEKFFNRYHLKAGWFQPMDIKEKGTMYLCFYQFTKKRIWTMEDIRFINDTKKILQGILERALAVEKLKQSEACYVSILDHAGCAIYVVDYDRKEILYVNEFFRQMITQMMDNEDFKSSEAELGKKCVMFIQSDTLGVPLTTEQDFSVSKMSVLNISEVYKTEIWKFLRQMREQISHFKNGRKSPIYENVSKTDFEFSHSFAPKEVQVEGKNLWLSVRQTQLDWIDGRKVSLGTISDITDKKLYEQKIERQISIDNLTGLYNRMRCEQDLERYIKEAELSGKEGAFLCIDLDDFKNINDALGHSCGDNLLKSIANSLSQVPGIEQNCYRINGDEFAVIVHGKQYKALSRICKDLRTIFSKPWFLKGMDYYCTMSMGVACFPTDGNNMDDLIRKVNLALSTAKKKGKNCVEFYNEKVEDTSYHRLDLEQNMRRATLNSCNEFEVYYQPIIKSGEGDVCCGAEALVRWNSSELGFIPPNDFIPLAEYLGLINPIGEHVLLEAVKRCKYWNDCGRDYKINVNISVIQLMQPDFVSKVKLVLDQTGIDPKHVVLEVTESLAVNDMGRMKEILNRMKQLGVGIALDDFGTGYSSLNHIREMPIDIIKIDRCFVENLTDDEFAGAFVKMVGELAKSIGVVVCVEGIEQKEQLKVLKNMNINMVQGYYYGKPMPVKEFEDCYL